MNYQYRAFGVPGLGLKRGLADDLVIAPYASALGLMVAPADACKNLQSLAAHGMAGRFGLYEAMDCTPDRVPSQRRFAIVRSYMAHHGGMGLLAFDYVLHEQPMQRRFLADPEFRSAALLLQERIPAAGIRLPVERAVAESSQRGSAGTSGEAITRSFTGADTPIPEVHLLSNGRYHVMVTNAGGGYSRWQDLALTALAGRCHARQLGNLLLCEGRELGRHLVHHLAALLPAAGSLRSDLFPGHRRVSRPQGSGRGLHQDGRLA